MKRISTLLLAGAMFFGAVSGAQAVDIMVKGLFEYGFGWAENVNTSTAGRRKGFDGRNANDRFLAQQRLRNQFDFVASDALRGVVMFEIGDHYWGQEQTANGVTNNAARLDADGVNIETKRAYIDWMVPNTDLSIRMGIQGLALPSATRFNNPVFDADVAAITASYKFNDMFALTGFWARPFDAYNERNEFYVQRLGAAFGRQIALDKRRHRGMIQHFRAAVHIFLWSKFSCLYPSFYHTFPIRFYLLLLSYMIKKAASTYLPKKRRKSAFP